MEEFGHGCRSCERIHHARAYGRLITEIVVGLGTAIGLAVGQLDWWAVGLVLALFKSFAQAVQPPRRAHD